MIKNNEVQQELKSKGRAPFSTGTSLDSSDLSEIYEKTPEEIFSLGFELGKRSAIREERAKHKAEETGQIRSLIHDLDFNLEDSRDCIETLFGIKDLVGDIVEEMDTAEGLGGSTIHLIHVHSRMRAIAELTRLCVAELYGSNEKARENERDLLFLVNKSDPLFQAYIEEENKNVEN